MDPDDEQTMTDHEQADSTQLVFGQRTRAVGPIDTINIDPTLTSCSLIDLLIVRLSLGAITLVSFENE